MPFFRQYQICIIILGAQKNLIFIFFKYFKNVIIAISFIFKNRPILLQDRASLLGSNSNKESTGERIIMPMQWGLVPSWHHGDPKKFSFNMINCRYDTIQEKKSFSKALKNGQRCIVLAEGFVITVDSLI